MPSQEPAEALTGDLHTPSQEGRTRPQGSRQRIPQEACRGPRRRPAESSTGSLHTPAPEACKCLRRKPAHAIARRLQRPSQDTSGSLHRKPAPGGPPTPSQEACRGSREKLAGDAHRKPAEAITQCLQKPSQDACPTGSLHAPSPEACTHPYRSPAHAPTGCLQKILTRSLQSHGRKPANALTRKHAEPRAEACRCPRRKLHTPV